MAQRAPSPPGLPPDPREEQDLEALLERTTSLRAHAPPGRSPKDRVASGHGDHEDIVRTNAGQSIPRIAAGRPRGSRASATGIVRVHPRLRAAAQRAGLRSFDIA